MSILPIYSRSPRKILYVLNKATNFVTYLCRSEWVELVSDDDQIRDGIKPESTIMIPVRWNDVEG